MGADNHVPSMCHHTWRWQQDVPWGSEYKRLIKGVPATVLAPRCLLFRATLCACRGGNGGGGANRRASLEVPSGADGSAVAAGTLPLPGMPGHHSDSDNDDGHPDANSQSLTGFPAGLLAAAGGGGGGPVLIGGRRGAAVRVEGGRVHVNGKEFSPSRFNLVKFMVGPGAAGGPASMGITGRGQGRGGHPRCRCPGRTSLTHLTGPALPPGPPGAVGGCAHRHVRGVGAQAGGHAVAAGLAQHGVARGVQVHAHKVRGGLRGPLGQSGTGMPWMGRYLTGVLERAVCEKRRQAPVLRTACSLYPRPCPCWVCLHGNAPDFAPLPGCPHCSWSRARAPRSAPAGARCCRWRRAT